MITMGLISCFGLNRLGLGVRSARWGWDRYCHTNIFGQMKSRKSLWTQITLAGSSKICVKSKIDNWVKYQKKRAPAGDLKRVLLKLHKYRRFYQALQVYEWMRKKGIYKFSSSDHAVMIDLIWRVRGCFAAEHHVRNLPKQAINDKTYGELLHCYVHEHKMDEALLHFQKMKELGFASSSRPFNEIMLLYARSRQIDKVLGVLGELKKSKVSPDNDSYRICISSFGLKYDPDGMERMLREMETQPHIVMDWCTYAVVAEFYDRNFLVDKATDALKKAEVILQKKDLRRKSPNFLLQTDYENVIKALVKVGELDEAMKFVKEWEASGNCFYVNGISIPYTIAEECIKNTPKLQDAFHKKVKTWSRKGKKIDVDKCKEYLKVGKPRDAFDCFLGHCVTRTYEIQLMVMKLFLKYLEEECGSFYPLRCTKSVIKPAIGTIFLEDNPKPTQAPNLDYEKSIKSLVESGELNEARKMVIEWEASGNWRRSDLLNILVLIIEGYCKKSLFMEAEALAKAWTREKRSQVASIWSALARNYQEQGKMVKGFECMRTYFNLTPSRKDKDDMLILGSYFDIIEYSRGHGLMHED